MEAPVKETARTLPFNAEISKVLKLVIHSLYTNRDIFLRELISNASDACEKLRYLGITQPDLLKDDAQLKITIRLNEKERTLAVVDNGIGMNGEDLITHLGTIAKSGTEQFLAQLSGDTKKDASLIGQFGVGFYSAFMVADKVTVISRKAGEAQGWKWESAGEGEFSITQQEDETPRGTQVILHLRNGEDAYLDKFKVQHIISTYSDHIAFPIEYVGEEGDAHEVLNDGSALWARPKSEITEEQYKEFYHHVSHTADDPFLVLHNQVEGKVCYTNLLFIPSLRPFDLFHPDRRRRVKLYVKRVFITDENVELIPHYLRFLRGIVDSQDLPLNISRETLQVNPMMTAIRDSLTKRVLTELKRKAEKEPEAYAEFWANFGAVLKEGLCEGIAFKEQLLETCRFHTTHDNGEKLTGLDDYIARMKEGQEYIYYITGDRLDTLRQHPQLEAFLKSGVEVVLLHDHVDDFWVTVSNKFKGKTLRSVLNAGAEFEKLMKEETEPEQKKEQDSQISTLIAALKTVYGDEVSDVRTTAKLTESPCCLAVEEGMMSMRMERFLVEHKQLPTTSARILEINPKHPIIGYMANKIVAGEKPQDIADIAGLLLDQARIVEGEELPDPATYIRRINQIIAEYLKA